jgi:two-component system, NtrC family, sensor kinase
VPKLLIKTGEEKGISYRVADQAVTIGREPSNTVVLSDALVSRRHARILKRGKQFVIEDLKSINGTFVNGEAVTRQDLKTGDTIILGETSLLFLPFHAMEEPVQEGGELPVSERGIKELTVEIALPPQETYPPMPFSTQSDLSHLNEAYGRLTLLYHLIRDLVTIVDFPEVLNKTLEKVMEIVKGDRALIILADDATGDLVPYVSRKREGLVNPGEISLSKSICRVVLESGQSILTSDAMQDNRFQSSESVMVQGIRSAMSAPIRSKNRLLGVIHVDTVGRLTSFSRDDLELLTAIGYQAGIAIENAKLFAETRRAHLELQERQIQLLEAEKLTALGKIAGGVAHEIINPMTVILGFTGIMRRKLDQGRTDQESIQEYMRRLNSVEEEANRVVQIVKSISRFYRRKKSDRVPTDVNEEIESALSIAEFRRRSTVEVIKDLSPELPKVLADRNQIQSVFLNLVSNAMDAIQDVGTITLTSSCESDGTVTVRVADTGCGIDPAIREKIFTPLFTTKEEGKGTGLGLSITQDIIENHGGTIEVQSAPGKGAVFTVTLPASGSPGSADI